MARKRKRAPPTGNEVECKKRKIIADSKPFYHPTLRCFYAQISTLRQYLLLQLPKSSKNRRRRLISREHGFLDDFLICVRHPEQCQSDPSRIKDFETFPQQVNLTAGSSVEGGSASQTDLIDFAIWLLFHRIYRHAHRPLHMLCYGYQRAAQSRQVHEEQGALGGIPGVLSYYPNGNVDILKSADWADVLSLLGKEGEQIMLKLVLDCGTFKAAEGEHGNYFQISGMPMTELQPLIPNGPVSTSQALKPHWRVCAPTPELKQHGSLASTSRSAAAITFVRNRMFYARAALNAKGGISFGLRHIHVFNRYSDSTSPGDTIHVMKYIFPRQFGLHNAFTSTVDPKETVQPFKDYTLREQEIAKSERQKPSGRNEIPNDILPKQKIPKRLRGETFRLIRKLQLYHSRCSYDQLLKYYCPFEGIARPQRLITKSQEGPIQLKTQTSLPCSSLCSSNSGPGSPCGIPQPSFFSLATPHSNVSAFTRAVIFNLIPNAFWGEGKEGKGNKEAIMMKIDQFIRLRRFENMTLHTVCQNIKINAMKWLASAHVDPKGKMSLSDSRKRTEILQEFLYYVFDSILIPLIRSNFHVTESNAHQNQLFYFRHDAWRAMTEPTVSVLKSSLLEEMKMVKARKILDARALGFSQIRLLPKASGLRPITNLRRRITKLQNGKMTLGRSINSIMTPVYNVLDYEKRKRPDLVGASLFSVGDMYPKLKDFAQTLEVGDATRQRLYFAKVDAKSCFDTIPQARLVRLVKEIPGEKEYRIGRHAEVRASEMWTHRQGRLIMAKPARKFISSARANTDFPDFDDLITTTFGKNKKNTVFVDGVVPSAQSRSSLLSLLGDHVESNIIKIGKKYHRQKAGIPQGSVLSSLLCNLFYAELERDYLAFLEKNESVLLRLIDDFLLITTNRDHAQRFLQIMHDGVKQYGIEVNPDKSLANFKALVNGRHVPQSEDPAAFPYCGNMIDTRTLEISKDRGRRMATVIANTLTVEPSKTPGETFYRKSLNALKIQTHKMFLDTSFNSLNTVLSTIYQNFVEASMKYYRYVKCMAGGNQPHTSLLICTISDLIDLAFVLIKGKHKVQSVRDYNCAVSKSQVQWLATTAFRNVLGRKQSKYGEVIAWLEVANGQAAPNNRKEAGRLNRIAKQGEAVYRGYNY